MVNSQYSTAAPDNFKRNYCSDVQVSKLRIAGVIKESVVDGPGLRFVIFTQGCPHCCIGCSNPHTHDFAEGYDITITQLLNMINRTKTLDGVTISGGEPFMQAAACAKLATLIKQKWPEFNILAYSGYYYGELLTMAKQNLAVGEFLQAIDILIDGPYDIKQHNPLLQFRGSNNQHVLELKKLKLS